MSCWRTWALAFDPEILQLIIQAKDLATEAIEALKKGAEELPQVEAVVNSKLYELRTEAQTFVAQLTGDRIKLAEIEKEESLRQLNDYYKQGLISAAEYSAAVAAINAKALSASADPSLFDRMKANWVGLSVTAAAVGLALEKAFQWAELGAKAKQAEVSFREVTDAYGIDGEKLLRNMQEVSKGIIDESDLMQRAVKAIEQGLSAEQIVRILEISRAAARTAGTDVATAFNDISNAIANQTPRALKQYGIMIDMNRAFEDQARSLGVDKDALSEYQQTQATATAAIAEGVKQLKAMGLESTNSAENLQTASAVLNDIKETVGTGVIKALDGVGIIFLEIGATALGFAGAVEKVISDLKLLTGDQAAAEEWSKKADAAFERAGNMYEKAGVLMADMTGFTVDHANALKGVAEQQRSVADAAEITTAKQKKAAELRLAEMQADANVFQATTEYEMSLEKTKYDQGKLSLDDWVAYQLRKEEELTAKLIAIKQEQEAAISKDPNLNETQRKEQIAAIEAEIVQLKLASYKKQDEIRKNAQNDEQISVEESGQKMIETIKDQNTVLEALDQEAVSQGFLRQSDYMEKRLERTRAEYDSEIAAAQDRVDKIGEIEGTDSPKYEAAVAAREQLQAELEATLITSEEAIRTAREQEETAATKFIAELTGDRQKLAEMETDGKLKELERYFLQGLIDLQQYRDGVAAIEESISGNSRERSRETALALSELLAPIKEMFRDLGSIVDSGFGVKEPLDDVRAYFRNTTAAIATDYKDMKAQIDYYQSASWGNIVHDLTSTSLVYLQQLYLFGKDVTNLSADDMRRWVTKVTNYVQEVKDLFQSLHETIAGWQDQIDQMKGKEVDIVDRWYKKEMQALKDKYGEEFKNNEEYQRALNTLNELYRLKRQKAQEEEAQDLADTQEGLLSHASSLAASMTGNLQDSVNNMMAGLSSNVNVNVSSLQGASAGAGASASSVNLGTMTLNIPSYDPATTERWVNDVLWPILQRKASLR